MKVIYSNICLVHNPEYETLSGKRVPYLESPKRYEVIREALSSSSSFVFLEANSDIKTDQHILSIHSAEYVDYMKNAYANWIEDGGDQAAVIPDTFPHPKLTKFKKNVDITKLKPIAKAGLYCFDLSTPITADTYKAAVAAVQVTLTASDILNTESKTVSSFPTGPTGVFALTRPPGHHAANSLCGGYCYFNNVAIAARFLQNSTASSRGALSGQIKVAVLDIDYHHGNGTQDIFYSDPSVFYVSLHAVPDYPYFTGTSDETGSGEGEGYNLNIPLPTFTTGDTEYLDALKGALRKIEVYDADYVIVSLGVDTYQHDPICNFKLTTEGYKLIGAAIATLGKPTLFVMEGGYFIADLGANVQAILESFETSKGGL